MSEGPVFDPRLETLRPTELAYVGPDGVEVWGFGIQPSTENMLLRHKLSPARRWTHCIQRIGDLYEVYDLSTAHRVGMTAAWTIGLPIYTGAELDAAVMFAILKV